jgi:hypothetical protein
MRRHLSTLVLALAVCGGSVAVAGCGGGGGSKSSDAQSSTVSVQQTKASRAHDCTALGHVATDLELATGMDQVFDYRRDSTFLDGYAGRAPSAVSDSVDRLRDFFDKFADAAKDVGLEPGQTPLPDQLDKLQSKFNYSDDDKAANARAVQTVDAWVSNGCAS